MSSVLVYLTMGDIAEAMGNARDDAGRKAALRWLRLEDKPAGSVLIRKGRRWFTTPERLLRAFPDLRKKVSDITSRNKTEQDTRAPSV